MREIYFKAKRQDNKGWVEGLLTVMWGQYHIINPDDENTAYPIIEKTVSQYVGLTDKNGCKIYENDIVKTVFDGTQNPNYVVVWDNDELGFKATNGKEHYGKNFAYLSCCEEIVVLGNIFDNIDLLEANDINS